MPLVPAKCTNCEADLEIENTKDAAICIYCGTAYLFLFIYILNL